MYVIPVVVGVVNVGSVTTPPTHTACVTVGATGVASMHVAAGFNFTVYTAVVAAGSPAFHGVGNGLTHLYPSANTAVTVTKSPAFGTAGTIVYVIPPPLAGGVTDGTVTTPSTHLDCDTATDPGVAV